MKKFVAFMLSASMMASLCSCAFLQKDEDIEVPSKRDAQKAAEKEYDLDLDFVSEDISRKEDEAEWVFTCEESDEIGGTITTITVTWSADDPDEFEFDEDIQYIEATVAETSIETTVTTVPTETEMTPTPTTSYSVYTPGSINDNSYTNNEFHIELTCPDDWSFATEAQISSLGQYVASAVSSDEWEYILENGLAAIECYIYNSNIANINFTISANSVGYTVEEYAEYALNHIPESTAEIMDVTNIEANSYEIDGVTYYGAEWDATINGATIYQRQIYLISDSGYLGTITFTSSVSQEANDIMYDVISFYG